ncbi:ribosome biogenesis GTPase Der [Candidatus Uhrbacteria bacterium]|nr:ribosome biogenesis GTPase Der [Candidatus Uhrbacteria bacterium]
MFTVALIGRTNVGKSTLFNRIIGSAKAIASAIPHTTRDRNVATTEWRGVPLRLIDTGGVDELDDTTPRRGRRDPITAEIAQQVALAVADADLLLLVVDARSGPLPGEHHIARDLRTFGLPIIVACNKVATVRQRQTCPEFAALGLGDPFPISAITGTGVGDLLDALIAHAPRPPAAPAEEPTEAPEPKPGSVRIAIVGEPNVGKSSLVNAILDRPEVIVHAEPFTTRDVHDVTFAWESDDDQIPSTAITLLDTAGVRRVAFRAAHGTKTPLAAIERVAVERSLGAIRHADVACLVLDATRTASHHTKQLAAAIVDARCAALIVVNKMDCVEEIADPGVLTARIHRLFPHFDWAPVLPTAAITRTGTSTLIPTALAAAQAWHRTLSPDMIAQIYATVKNAIPRSKTAFGRRRSNILELAQVGTAPPTFLLRTRPRVKLPVAIPRIVERALRNTLDFSGCPIRIVMRSTKA